MADDAGRAALDVLSRCHRYSTWLYDLVEPYIGNTVVEAGAGVGTLSSRVVERSSARRIVLTDADRSRVDELGWRFDGDARVSVCVWRLPEICPQDVRGADTFVLWNVLEHVEDDVAALRQMAFALAPGGKVVVVSPSGRDLYGPLDRAMGHFRRYARRELAAKARSAGLTPLLEKRVNLVGGIGWLLSARFSGASVLSRRGSRLFDLLVPAIRLWEDRVSVPWGLSVLFVAEKPSRATPPT
jgi:SAM-dependent methyltransferase